MDVIINAISDFAPEGSVSKPSQGNFYDNILSCLDYSTDFPPVAELLQSFYGLEGRWLIASPIHWDASHNSAIISACDEALMLTDEESLRWLQVWSEFAAPNVSEVYFHNAFTWLVRVDAMPAICAKPVHKIVHQSFFTQLEKLDESLSWQRLITECQMFLSAHPFNNTRKGYSINGVWFWGAGELGLKKDIPLVASSKNLLDLAKIASLNVSSLTSHPIGKKSITLLDGIDAQQALQKQLENKSVSWFWNNLAYATRPKRLLSRLWRS